jgi:hypothetical protein
MDFQYPSDSGPFIAWFQLGLLAEFAFMDKATNWWNLNSTLTWTEKE